MNIKNWFFSQRIAPIPHQCKFEFKSFSHDRSYHPIADLKFSKNNVQYFHSPTTAIVKTWEKLGFNAVNIYHSYWECECGKHQSFAFLASPFITGAKSSKCSAITQAEHTLMQERNPVEMGYARNMSLEEAVEDLCGDLGIEYDR